MIKTLLNKSGNFNKFLQSLENGENISVFGLGTNEKIAVIKECNSFCLLVASSDKICLELKEELEKANLNVAVLLTLPSLNFIKFNNELINFRETMLKVESGAIDVLIITPQILKQKFVNPNKFKERFLNLEVGSTLSLDVFKTMLQNSGLTRVDCVQNKNEFAIHGDVVQVFLNNEDNPLKISFFDTEVESIFYYDIISAKNLFEVENIVLPLGNFFNLNSNEIEDVKNKLVNYKQKFNSREQEDAWNKQVDSCLLEIDSGNLNINFLTPFVDDATYSIFNYLNINTTIFYNEPKQILAELNNFETLATEEIKNFINNGVLCDKHLGFIKSTDNVFEKIKKFTNVAFQAITTANNIFRPQKVFSFVCLPKISYNKKYEMLADDCYRLSVKNVTVVLYVKNMELAKMLEGYLNRKKVLCSIVPNLSGVVFGSVNLVTKEDNVSFGLLEENIVVIGTYDIFADKKHNKQVKTNNDFSEEFLPKENDYVVHEVHGVGKYLKTQKLTFGGIEKDYALIEYKFGDKLYLPIENLNTISKYIGGDKVPTLNKLGGEDFAKTVSKVKSGVKELAFNLAKLYAERENKKPNIYVEDDEIQASFESAFKFTETPDQLKAINDVKADMMSPKIMDRLICGDVGYGKTEVAMRAMFKCVMSGHQVAFLCPTTILSEQHFVTCVNRMQSFGVTVEVLNRFKTLKQQKEILEKVKNKNVDILIGTHRILSSDVEIPNLALLVIDEEQRFGVADKEKIKNIKKNVDVLTLSATPIPRTLNLSLVGIRDISVIETPPVNRIDVNVSVVAYSDALVKNAIEKELSRNGQVLIVYNIVQSIYEFKHRIKTLIGEDVAVSVAHGQMDSNQLENEIYKLYNNETQVLISTTLIENGIDLPNANTIIVINADKLGLSQLYQLKGRVGRSDRQAFAYFTFNDGKALTEDGYKRLSAISEFSTMGSGFKIAMRDLEIRGAGNLLGANQHGHLEKVGYAMYVKLLKEAVDEIEGKNVKTLNEVKISTKYQAYIPENLVKQESVRINLYSQISKLQSCEELNAFIEKTQNMFVCESVPVSNLATIATIKNLASFLKVKEVLIFDDCKLIFDKTELKDCVELSNMIQSLNIKANINVVNNPTVQFIYKNNNLQDYAEIMQNLVNIVNKK